MSAPDTKKSSETNWEYIDSLTDGEIDTSDSPPFDERLLARAQIRWPSKQQAVTVHLDPETFAWYRAQGEDWEMRMLAALRIYAQAHDSGTVKP